MSEIVSGPDGMTWTIGAAMSVPGVLSCEVRSPSPGCVTLLYRGDVSTDVVHAAVQDVTPIWCNLVVERQPNLEPRSPAEFSDPGDHFRKQKARRLAKLTEAQAVAKTRPTAKLLHTAECHSNPSVRNIARAELLARAEAGSRLPDIRDEWDNLPDAEPEGIVSRGARLVRGEES